MSPCEDIGPVDTIALNTAAPAIRRVWGGSLTFYAIKGSRVGFTLTSNTERSQFAKYQERLGMPT